MKDRLIELIQDSVGGCAYGDCKDCTECSNDSCGTKVLGGALELIKTQEQRIKELTEENEAWQKQLISEKEKADKVYYELACEVEDWRSENERLEENLIKQSAENIMLLIERQEIKVDTVRKMRERLTTFFASDDTLNHIEVDAEYINSQIDKIAKEMEEGEGNGT